MEFVIQLPSHITQRKIILILILGIMFSCFVNSKTIKMEMMRRNKNNFVKMEHLTQKHEPVGYKFPSESNSFLYGSINVTFEYLTSIELGSSSQLFIVIVDTGSCSLAVTASGCKQYTSNYEKTNLDCVHADAFYNINSGIQVDCGEYPQCICSRSSGKCSFELQYGDGSFLSGPLIKDKFSISGLSTEVYFGAIEMESESFSRQGVDGIMGMAYEKLYPIAGNSVFDQLESEGIVENSFSMCLGLTGGMMVLGGIDSNYSKGPMTYTPIIKETYYVVQMVDLFVENTSIGASLSELNGNHSIVDSGTTLMIINYPAFNKLVSTLQVYCQQFPAYLRSLCYPDQNGNSIFSGGLCWNLKYTDIIHFPTLNLQLNNTTKLALGPEYYFLEVSNAFCFGIMPGSGELGTILGDVFMQAYNVFFDRANKQIGFAAVNNCSGPSATLSLESGDGQNGAVGSELKNPLQVKAIFNNNQLAAVGLIILFNVTSGDASFPNNKVVTDSNGVASTTITLESSGDIIVTAQVYGTEQKVTFSLSGNALSVGFIILIVFAVLFFIAIIVGIIFFFIKHRRNKNSNFSEMNQEQKSSLLSDN